MITVLRVYDPWLRDSLELLHGGTDALALQLTEHETWSATANSQSLSFVARNRSAIIFILVA